MNFYPETLRYIADMCDALAEVEKKTTVDIMGVRFKSGIKIETVEGECDFGTLHDEIGGEWSWYPPKGEEQTS